MSTSASRIPRLSESLWETVKEHGKPVSYSFGDFLYYQNTASPGIFCIESGKVKIFKIMDNGYESFLRIASEGSLFGEASCFSGEDSSPAAIALSNVTGYLLSEETTIELIRSNPDFALFMVDNLIYKLKGQSDQVGNMSGKKVNCRLAATLYTLDYYCIPCDEDQWFSISHAELAGIIGATRPNVTAMLNQFSDQKIIELKRNRVRILNKERLKEIAEAEE